MNLAILLLDSQMRLCGLPLLTESTELRGSIDRVGRMPSGAGLPRSSERTRSRWGRRSMIEQRRIAIAEYSYTVLFEPAEEGGFVVTCPALRGLVTGRHAGRSPCYGPRRDSRLPRKPAQRPSAVPLG